ncbi:MAG: Ig-like domain-containing protein [bacterium]
MFNKNKIMGLKIYQYKTGNGLLFLKKWVLIFLLVTACAKQGMPPGGPVDKTPPRIIKTIPDTNSTFVDPNIRVEVVFNEWLNSRTVEDAVFISPYVGDDVKIKTGGKKIIISFPQPLKKEFTYVITFGTNIKDTHNNGLEKSFTLAFSTGGRLDKGEIKGKVYGEKNAKGINVWAYLLSGANEVNPSVSEPDYIIQCEEGGDFHLTHISLGEYRLFAIEDRIADRLYSKGEDRIGLTYSDVFIPFEEPHIADSIFFRMFLQDTLRPALTRAVSVNKYLVQLLFDQPIRFDKQTYQDNVAIYPVQDSLNTLTIKNYFVDPNDNRSIQVLTEPLSEGEYIARVKGIVSISGNPIDPEFNTVEFNAAPEEDTKNPEIIRFIPSPGQKDVFSDQDIRLVFNEAIDTTVFNQGFSLIDTLTGSISGVFKWINPAEVSFIPEKDFKSLRVYKVKLSGKWIKDRSGNSMTDTLYHFKTINKDTLSGISGTIIDPDTLGQGDVYVNLNHIENEEIYYQQKTNSTGNFKFSKILPGQYTISCFSDKDSSGNYSYGNPYPFRAAERFIVYSDTVLAKPRWPNAGNNIILPSYQHGQE